MIHVTVLYPHAADVRFDHDYYRDRHLPMVAEKLGPALKRYAIDRGIAGGAPGAPPPFVAAVRLYFDSVEAFQGSFGPKASEILADIPNYTNAQPMVVVNEVVKD